MVGGGGVYMTKAVKGQSSGGGPGRRTPQKMPQKSIYFLMFPGSDFQLQTQVRKRNYSDFLLVCIRERCWWSRG